MKRLVVLALVIPLLLAALPAPARGADGGGKTIVIVLAPDLKWDDVKLGRTPFLARAAAGGAVGNASATSGLKDPGTAGPSQAALTLSAGVPANEDPKALSAFSATETVASVLAADYYTLVTGLSPGENTILFLGLPQAAHLNENAISPPVLGLLGECVKDAGGSTAGLGNGDAGNPPGAVAFSRGAGIAAMDVGGRTAAGDVSTGLLIRDASAPYGLKTNLPVFRSKLRALLGSGTGSPRLVVLDPGDMQRASRFAKDVAPSVAARQRLAALRTLDEVSEMAARALRPEDHLFIVGTLVPQEVRGKGPGGLVPVIEYGAGVKGNLTSSSTHRPGLLSLLDVSVTVLDRLGIERPVGMMGSVMEARPVEGQDRITHLLQMNTTAVAVDTVKPTVLNLYILLTVLLLLACTALLFWIRVSNGSVRTGLVRLAHGLLLFDLAVPLAATLMFAVWPWPSNGPIVVALLLGVAVAVWLAASWAGRGRDGRLALAILCIGTLVVLAIDQWAGAAASFSSLFSYSPLVGARFYGMGNEGASMLVGASLVGTGLLLDLLAPASLYPVARRWLLPVVGALVVITAAAPFLGANVGVAIWGLAGFALAWAHTNGYRVGWRGIALIAVMSAVLITAFSVLDLGSVSGAQTHLGRAWSSVGKGGMAQLWLIVWRKAETNMRILTRTNWSWLLLAVLAVLGYMGLRPQGEFRRTLELNPGFAAAMTACFLSAAVGYLTEDSGIVIPSLVMLYAGTGILSLMLLPSIGKD